ncbi:MAG TPA: tryptophan 2,3-dioxygenase family protein [Cytophagales bacterium]|nr:tryptophan 2,3-dioxygenase family protein [Cytophagales bacterium]
MMNNKEEVEKKIAEKIAQLQQRYAQDQQDITVYLDGLYRSKYLSYWEYIKLETLLTLQSTQTNYPDEKIFVVFHQSTELYFNLILDEIKNIAEHSNITASYLITKLKRINRYLELVNSSFEIMIHEMSNEEFVAFRSALFPSSGFQSIQYRKIEVCATDIENLIDPEVRANMAFGLDVEQALNNIYWKRGATEKATGMPSLTVRQFESKYSAELLSTAQHYKDKNIWKRYVQVIKKEGPNGDIDDEMRRLDHNFNVQFALAHLKAAVRHLKNASSTGGTNWQKYLPPRFQKTIFFPDLWTAEEIESWGREYVYS